VRYIVVFYIFFVLVFTGCAAASYNNTGESIQTEISEAERYYSFAFEHMRQKNYDEAIPLLKKSIDADSTYVDAYLALRQVYLLVGDTSAALTICRKGITCFSNPEDNRKMAQAIASLYAKIGQGEKAEQLFEKIIKDNPKDPTSYDLYASYLESQGRYDEALASYKKAYELNPDNGGVAFRLGNAYFERGRYTEAVTYLKKAKEAFGNDIETIKKLGEAYLELKEYGKAIEEYKLIIEIIPQHVSSRIQIGNAYLKLGQYNTAENYYKEALQIETSNLTVYYQLINLELTRNNLSGVKNYINKGFSIDPNDGILYALYGEYFYRLGLRDMRDKEWNPAIEKFEESIRIWQKTKTKTNDPKWIQYAQKGISNARRNIEEVKKVRW
jgi:tetratricopeptide (TPR) repeat protein